MYRLDENTANWTKMYAIRDHQFKGLRIPQCLATGEIVNETWIGDFQLAKHTSYLWNPEISNCFIKKRGVATIDPMWDVSYSHVESLVCVKGMEIIGKEDENKKKIKPWKDWTELLFKDFESLLHLM